jgi:hypothetical protein
LYPRFLPPSIYLFSFPILFVFSFLFLLSLFFSSFFPSCFHFYFLFLFLVLLFCFEIKFRIIKIITDFKKSSHFSKTLFMKFEHPHAIFFMNSFLVHEFWKMFHKIFENCSIFFKNHPWFWKLVMFITLQILYFQTISWFSIFFLIFNIVNYFLNILFKVLKKIYVYSKKLFRFRIYSIFYFWFF